MNVKLLTKTVHQVGLAQLAGVVIFVTALTLVPTAAHAQDELGAWPGGPRTCIPLERYEAATPLPGGCRALVPGILLTIDEEHRRAQRTNELGAEAAELHVQLERERREHAASSARCGAVVRGAGHLVAGAGDVLEEVSTPTPWTDRLAGAGVGAALVGVAWVLSAIVQ